MVLMSEQAHVVSGICLDYRQRQHICDLQATAHVHTRLWLIKRGCYGEKPTDHQLITVL